MKEVGRYFKVWLKMSFNSFRVAIETWQGAVLFLVAKLLRFGFYFAVIYTVVSKVRMFSGYDLNQVVFFFLTFNLVDVLSQLLFREVYRFRPMVVSGDFDLVLVKPMNPLLRVVLGGGDFLDLVTLVPLVGGIIYYVSLLGNISFVNGLVYFVLVVNGIFISFWLHVVVCAICILTTDVDHAIMIYRDFTSMARVPTDIYSKFLQGMLTFFVPVVIMITFPAKAMLGALSGWGVGLAFLISGIIFFLSKGFWRYSLKRYTSASS